MTEETTARLRTALGDRYVVEREIGRGGMATVYLATDSKHRRQVAIKVVRPELGLLVGADRFLQEIEIAAGLHHPNILQLYDSGEADGLLYYVMPYVEGDSLRTRLRRDKQLPIDEAVRLTAEVADALSCAHTRGIVHRDIKPENILLESGHALVADFGIAQVVSRVDEERITATGSAIGTPEYMSPEQSGGERDIDVRSDIYSLGCVLYEMLAGEPPFSGSTPQALIARHALEKPPSLSIVRPTTETLVGVVERALAKAPADRFQTAAEFRDALLGGAPPRPPRARRGWTVTTVAAVVVAAVGVLLLWPGAPPTLDPNRVVVFPLVTPDDSLNAAGAGWDVALAIGGALEHSQPLKWIDGWSRLADAERADPRLVTPERASEISRERGAGHYIDGAIRRTGRQMGVVLRLHDVTGDSMVAQESGTVGVGEDVSTLALRTVTRLLPALLEPGQPVDLSPLTDRNPGANALAIQGDRAYRRADFQTALEFYRRTVAEDSLHAFAAVKAAQAASWLNHLDEAGDLIRLGLAHVELLPEKYQLYARGVGAANNGMADSALAYLNAALQIDTQWPEAWMALGETYHHLLPDAAPLDSLAKAAFLIAREVDTTFTPPLLHLAEMAIQRGDVPWATRALGKLAAVESDTTQLRKLSLMIECARNPSPAFPWRAAVEENASAVVLAGKNLSVAMMQPVCALGAFRAVLGRPDLSAGFKWAALLGVNGVLLAQRQYDEALAVIDSSLASGMRSAYFLYVLGALAGAPFDAGASEAERVAREGAGEHYERAGPETQWMFAVWHARHGRTDRLETIARNLRTAAEGDPKAALFADALDAHLALARGDTTRSLELLEELKSVGTDNEILWSAGLSLAEERHVLAELQLARGRYAEAYATATVFDHPGPIMFLPHVPRSVEIRAEAAEVMGQVDVARRLWGRLHDLGNRGMSTTTN